MKDVADVAEIELKFSYANSSYHDSVARLQRCLPSDLGIHLLHAILLQDVYVDTPTRTFSAVGACFRFRTSDRKKKVSANFKPPGTVSNGVLERRELRTSMKRAEATAYLAGGSPQGAAVETAFEFAASLGAAAPREATLCLLQNRRILGVSHGGSLLLGIMFDEVEAIAIDVDEAEELLARGALDLRREHRVARFGQGEVELWAQRFGEVDLAREVFDFLVSTAPSWAAAVVPESKYTIALRALEVSPGRT